ncbi:hypothetical protein BKA04_000752 [Cryobacterium mesophilum]|uniref:HNH endonuclease n=1 Tax=Terrimesophilobacter mesophilus TaxID=433647 RepID=A0A4R8V9C6_9MICO|nr:HNH endonuclease signature motif containing protein [Terrimesophilobacter mesophilus]MBB5632529.1 hypothetical protein [Terrimesophilobacter mesophilus]TFB79353.1 HNH endonuclease [Terrimesophilobacter mesophilus]
MSFLAQTLEGSAAAVSAFGVSTRDYDALPDDRVLELGVAIAAHERAFGLVKAQHAAQVARRSRREFGHTGLAARNGFASPQKLLQQVTKVTAREAGQLVNLGNAIGEAEAARELLDNGVTEIGGVPVETAWDEPICRAVTTGALSVECADALRRGLGKPDGDITAERLRELATELLRGYGELPADALFQRARAERDLNDLDGIAARQQEQYLQGGFRLFRKANGMFGYAGQADPESAAVLMGALDPLTSPRRGGPRFTRPEDIARAKAIVDDPRTTERITLDGLVALVKAAGGLDPQTIPSGDHTLVKVLVPAASVEHAEADEAELPPQGFGVIESTGTTIAVGTAEAGLCDSRWQEITIDTCGNPLDVGRTRRLFDRRQREALAVRDGGCMWPECLQPPSFTEAHHIEQWKRDRGRTDLENGILLCRFHHLLLHNNHWELHRDAEGRYWLTPPAAVDSDRVAVQLESKNLLTRARQRSRQRPGSPPSGAPLPELIAT